MNHSPPRSAYARFFRSSAEIYRRLAASIESLWVHTCHQDDMNLCGELGADHATATVDAWYTSVGIGRCSRQVIAIGLSPSCET